MGIDRESDIYIGMYVVEVIGVVPNVDLLPLSMKVVIQCMRKRISRKR